MRDVLESSFSQRPDSSIILQKPLPSGQNLPEGGENRTGNKGEGERICDKAIRLGDALQCPKGKDLGLSEFQLFPWPAQSGIRKHLCLGDWGVPLLGHIAGPTQGLNHSAVERLLSSGLTPGFFVEKDEMLNGFLLQPKDASNDQHNCQNLDSIHLVLLSVNTSPSPAVSKWLQSSSSLNNLDEHHDDGDDQQDMNDPTHRVASQQSQQPQN
jgi:hypothetical protein